jgi:CRISPR system Cascade subunit CasA
MDGKEFNLLDEPWILVLNKNGITEELSLLEVFERAHELTILAGELLTQDVAILRLLLAVLYATFTREDENGNRSSLNTSQDALLRWKRLWNLKRFPIGPIKKRLTTLYHERFYLFHPERPFYQVAGLKLKKDEKFKPASQLIMDVPSREERQFLTNRRGEPAQKLSYAEAARWLVCLHAWDYAGKKQSIVGGAANGGGTGWLGKLGIVCIERKNLFEQLLLNFVLLKDGVLLPYGIPVWEEKDPPTVAKRDRVPAGYCELLTWQSRRVLLNRRGTKVDGLIRSYGDVFDKGNTFIEQMCGWHLSSAKNSSVEFIPNKHKANRSIWRDLGAILPSKRVDSEKNKIPGSIDWLNKIGTEDIGHVQIRAVGVELGTMDAIVNELINDKLSINAEVFAELEQNWATRITDLLKVTDKCVASLGRLAADIAEASGDNGPGKDGKKNAAKEEAYFRLDSPFRTWLATINPKFSNMDEKGAEWKKQAGKIIFDLGVTLVNEAGNKAFVGTSVINSPKAYAKFRESIREIINK